MLPTDPMRRFRRLPVLLPLLAPALAAQATPAVVSLDSLLEQRVSTAAKYSQRVSEVAGSVTIVTSEDINEAIFGVVNLTTKSPAHLLKAGLIVTPASWFRPGAVLRHEPSRRTVYQTSTSPSLLLDLNLALSHPLGGGVPLAASTRINNLLDTRYATPGGVEHPQPSIPQDGRTLNAELRHGF